MIMGFTDVVTFAAFAAIATAARGAPGAMTLRRRALTGSAACIGYSSIFIKPRTLTAAGALQTMPSH